MGGGRIGGGALKFREVIKPSSSELHCELAAMRFCYVSRNERLRVGVKLLGCTY